MDPVIGVVIALLLILVFLGAWKVMSAPMGMRRRKGMSTAAPAIQVAVTPTSPAVAVAQPSGTPSATVNTTASATPVAATAATPSGAASAAVTEYMTTNKWAGSWSGMVR